MHTTPHLTPLFSPESEARIRKTYPGQAHWAGTGPFAENCGRCEHFGCERQIVDRRSGEIKRTVQTKGCAKFQELTGKIGPAIPKYAEACRHFERRGN